VAKIGLAWDLGAGRGHAVRLASLARRVRERGDEPVLFARNLRTLRGALDGDVPVLLPAPHNDWVPRDATPASWADILWSECGLHDEAQAIAIALAWRDALAASGVSSLLADGAPLAVAAAGALRLRCVAIGTGFLVPPPGPPWPPYRTWEAVDDERLAMREHQLRDRIAALRAALGLVREGALPAGDAQALFTYPALDHYPARDPAGVAYVGPMLGQGGEPAWPAGSHRVLVYAPANHPLLGALHEALQEQREVAALAHFGGAMPWGNSACCRVETRPIDVAQALAQADLVVTPGGNLAIAAAARGVPSLLLPTQAETFLTAMRLAGLGAAVACTDAGQLRAALREALGDALAAGAHALGARLWVMPDDAIADRVLDLLA
jgi:UDP:flavonoid glycosyltransferase YjiC (YdhE family)